MLRYTTLILLLILVAGTAVAQTGPKQLSAGVGVYVVTTDNDAGRENMEGHAITASMAFGPGSAARGHLYFTKHEDNDDLKLEGFDVQFLLGSNLTRAGFKMYALGGYWSETLELDVSTKSDNSRDFSGFMAGLGIGYNWPSATLDLWVAWRDLGDYGDFVEEDDDVTMGAGALSFGLRF